MENVKILNVLEDIKKLLMMGLAKEGVSSDEIGKALGVSGARIRQQVSFGGVKKTKGK